MGNGNPHDGGVELMSGTWKVHRSLSSLMNPPGLHRVFYQVIFDKKDDFFNGEGDFDVCLKKKVYRYRRDFK